MSAVAEKFKRLPRRQQIEFVARMVAAITAKIEQQHEQQPEKKYG